MEQITFFCRLLGFPHPSPKYVNDVTLYCNCVTRYDIKGLIFAVL